MSSSLVEETRRRSTSRRIVSSALAALRPPPNLTVSQWADTERKLSAESSASPGQWKTSRAEYQRGFMDAVSDARNRRVIGVFGSQTGKTDCLLNAVGYHIQYDPAPMLMIQPTLEMAEAWSKDRLAPMLRDTPALRDKLGELKARDSGQTIRHKTFRGGHLTAAGANSPASLAGRPIRIVIGDEVERWPPSAGAEGSPIQLVSTRTAGFWNAKELYISSPGFKGSPFEQLWLESDQRRYFVPCGECGHFQYLRWSQVDYKDENGDSRPDLAVYVCEDCTARWNDIDRWTAVARGEWRATAPFTDTAGFHLPALCAPWESRKLERLAKLWIAAHGDNERRKVFVNTVLAEWWEEQYETLQPEGLEGRREEYPVREGVVLAPPGVAIITAGVDVQDNRIEVQIQGYGAGAESWKLQYHVLDGDPTAPAVWQELWEILIRPIPMARGGFDYVRATCVDSGAHAIRVYDFCRPRFRYVMPDGLLAYVWAIKARAGPGKLWPVTPNRNNKGKIPLFTVYVDSAKEHLYAALSKTREPGPGYVHFPRAVSVGQGKPFDKSYFAQLTSEKVTPRRNPNGTITRVWEKKSDRARNEALDTSIYGECALHGLIGMGLDLEAEAERINGTPDKPPPPTQAERRRSTSQWLNR